MDHEPSASPLQPGTFNVISGNVGGVELRSGHGIDTCRGQPDRHRRQRAEAIGNDGDGIDVVDSAPNTIGGTAAGAGNLISANAGAGVSISGAARGRQRRRRQQDRHRHRRDRWRSGNAGSGIVISEGSSSNSIGQPPARAAIGSRAT